MNSAIQTINLLEQSILEQEKIFSDLLFENAKLQNKLLLLSPSSAPSKPKSLYTCEKCPMSFPDIQHAFRHEDIHPTVFLWKNQNAVIKPVRRTNFKQDLTEAQQNHYRELLKRKDLVVKKTSPYPRQYVTNVKQLVRSQPQKSFEKVVVLKCRYCPTTTADKTNLHIHTLLHKDLTYFQCPWPKCQLVFGVPSKLKTHHFLTHDIVLAAEEKCTIGMEARIQLTR